MLKYFNVYERKYTGDLHAIGTIQANDASHAKAVWDEQFGDNYGKVFILPVVSARFGHVAFKEA